MTEKFDLCLATTVRSAEERRRLLANLGASASVLISPPVWTMRVRGLETVESAWSDEPIDVPKGWIVFLYPRPRSPTEGGWCIEIVDDTEVWTLFLPVAILRSHSNEVMDVLWRMGEVSLPCVAGNEYSMAEVRRSRTDVLAEAESFGSLATRAVVQNGQRLRGWSTVRGDADRALLARGQR